MYSVKLGQISLIFWPTMYNMQRRTVFQERIRGSIALRLWKKTRVLHLHQLAMPCDRSKATCRKLGIHCTWNRRHLVARTAPDSACSNRSSPAEEPGGERSLGKPGRRGECDLIPLASSIRPRTGDFISRNSPHNLQRKSPALPILETGGPDPGTLVPWQKDLTPIRSAICRPCVVWKLLDDARATCEVAWFGLRGCMCFELWKNRFWRLWNHVFWHGRHKLSDWQLKFGKILQQTCRYCRY